MVLMGVKSFAAFLRGMDPSSTTQSSRSQRRNFLFIPILFGIFIAGNLAFTLFEIGRQKTYNIVEVDLIQRQQLFIHNYLDHDLELIEGIAPAFGDVPKIVEDTANVLVTGGMALEERRKPHRIKIPPPPNERIRAKLEEHRALVHEFLRKAKMTNPTGPLRVKGNLRELEILTEKFDQNISDVMNLFYRYGEQRLNSMILFQVLTALLFITFGVFMAIRLLQAAQAVQLENAQRRTAEAKLRSLNTSLEQKVEERTQQLKLYANELSRSNDELSQFANVVSHDLKAPLRSVASLLTLLSDQVSKALGQKENGYISSALESIHRMDRLIRDLLNYGAIGSELIQIDFLESSEAVQMALKNLSSDISELGAKIKINTLPRVAADRSQLTQIFQNLIGNALKFSDHKQPEIEVSGKSTQDSWEFCIKDNGIGIEPKDREKIFQMFSRGYAAGKYQGSGVGLAIVKRIVERHRGRLWVDSEPGKGSKFYIKFPRNELEAEALKRNPLTSSASGF